MQKEKRRVRAGEGEEKVGLGTLRGDAQYLYAPLCRCTLGRYNEVVQLSREDVTFHLNKGAQKNGTVTMYVAGGDRCAAETRD